MKRKTSMVVAMAASSLLLAGCSTPTRDIDVEKEGIKRADQADVQDFRKAAKEMVESMVKQGALGRFKEEKGRTAVIAFNRVVNDTGEYIDVDQLTMRVSEELLNSGLAELDTTWGAKPINPDDPSVLSGKVQLPDFTLVGKIRKDTARAGDMKQGTYTFMLILTNSTTGRAAWQSMKQITKQGTKSSIGL